MFKRINNIQVGGIRSGESRPIEQNKGYKLFPLLYSNIYVCARRRSGKTTTIFKILKECMGKDTQLIIVCPTVDKDAGWRHIVEYFEKRGNLVTPFGTLKEGKKDNLAEIMEMLNIDSDSEEDSSDSDEEDDQSIKRQWIKVDDEPGKEKSRKSRKPKYIAPKSIVVCDDLGSELRSVALTNLIKRNRHYKCKLIMSSQYPQDILPAAWKNLDYALLFGGHAIEKLELMFKHMDLTMPFEKFKKIYDAATKKKFSFLWVSMGDDRLRRNFNEEPA